MPARTCTLANLEKGFRLASKSLENIRKNVKKSGTQLLIYCCKISSSPFNLVPNGFLRFGERKWKGGEKKEGMTYTIAGSTVCYFRISGF